jgi:hypothetical protein
MAGSACLVPASNKEVRGGKDDPRNDSEHARKQHNVDGESGHDTLPTQHAPLSREAKTTPEGWRKGDDGMPKFKQWYPGGISLQAGALSNAQCEQRHEADATEQHRECHGIIFKPISQIFIGKRAPGCFFHLCPGALPATAIVGEGTGRPLKNRTLAGDRGGAR